MSESSYSPALADQICARISDGPVPIKTIAEEIGVSPRTIFRWLRENPEFERMYLIARENQAEIFAEQILEIADTPQQGTKTIKTPKGEETIQGDMIEHRKLQVDTRKWLASKYKVRRFGDKLAVDGALEFSPLDPLSAFEAVRRIAFALELGKQFLDVQAVQKLLPAPGADAEPPGVPLPDAGQP